MSGRHRLVKRRIRELEHFANDATFTMAAYERVIRDASGLCDLTHIRERYRFWCDKRRDIVSELQREEELLANMPKTLGASPHDAGDEEQYRDEKPKQRSAP